MVTMDDSAIFVDTNILVYASVPSAPQHLLASKVLQHLRDAGTELVISQQILREYIAVIVRLQNAGSGLLTEKILQNVTIFRAECRVVADQPAIMDKLLELLEQVPDADRRIYDANIVATMVVHDLPRLLTHNTKDFMRFAHLIEIMPLET